MFTSSAFVCLCVCADLPQTSAGVRAADGEGGGDDLRQLEGAHHVQHQTAQVRTDKRTQSRFYCTLHNKTHVKASAVAAFLS